MNNKIAFVHDRIVHEGWGESVLQTLIHESQFSQGKIFVLFSTYKKRNNLEVVTALPKRTNSIFSYFTKHKIFFFSKLFDYRNLMFWFPWLCRLLRKKIQKYDPDNLIISSFAAVKNIILPIQEDPLSKKTLLYLHSPMQYIRENYEDNIKKLTFPIKQFYKIAAKYLRPRDRKPRQYQIAHCNSEYTAKLAKQLYNIDCEVRYPKVDKAFFEEPITKNPKDYFIFVGRVQRYVREIDKIINLYNKFHLPLIVMWDGPDMAYAQQIAWETIVFVWQIHSPEDKIQIIKNARGMINLAKESCWIATMEALSLWVPIFWFNAGWTKELVDETTGILCDSKDEKTLEETMHMFLAKQFNREQIAKATREKLQSIK